MSNTPRLRLCHAGMEGRSLHAFEIFLSRITSIEFQITPEDQADVGFIDLDHERGPQLLEEQRRLFPSRPLIVATQKALASNDALVVPLGKPIGLGAFTAALEQVRTLLPASWAAPTPLEAAATPAPAPVQAQPAPVAASAAPQDEHSLMAQQGQDSLFLLRQQEERMAAFYVGTKPDIDLNDATARVAVFYEPANFLQGTISRARSHAQEIGRPVKINDGLGTVLYLSPGDNHAHQVCSNNSLRALAQLPTQPSVQMGQIDHHELASMEDFPTRPLISLEWDAALWASRGRLPLGTDLDAPVRLNAWPDLTRLVIPPEAMRIAGLWSRQRLSLRQTLEQLQIPQRYVFAFYSACHALNLVSQPELARQTQAAHQHPTPSATPEPQESVAPQQPAMRGLFKRLLGKLLGTRLGEAEAG
ncbi:MAG: hypothetical protein LWW92_02305 [Rhodocyclales bacterium]|nr:hypothetical protein [Rhodocyclales bacterium]